MGRRRHTVKGERIPGFAERLTRRLIQAGYISVSRPGRVVLDVPRLARELAVTEKAVYRWVQGEIFPETYLDALAGLLRISVDELLGRCDALVAPAPPADGPSSLSTGYPQVDAMLAFLRGELVEIWERAPNAQHRAEFMEHFARQARLFRKIFKAHDTT
jgi:hypothetical protein